MEVLFPQEQNFPFHKFVSKNQSLFLQTMMYILVPGETNSKWVSYIFGSFPFVPPPPQPQLSGWIIIAPTDERAIFVHKD